MKRGASNGGQTHFGPAVVVLGIVSLAFSILLFAHPDLAGGEAGRPVSSLGWAVPAAGLAILFFTLALFTREVLAAPGAHSRHDLGSARTAVLLFIFSEIVLFAALFASYFYFAFGYSFAGEWPPLGLEKPQPWGAPLIGTVLLLASGLTAVAAHHLFLNLRPRATGLALAAAILLGLAFLALQLREFARSSFSYQDGVYPSAFFLATGLHGVHVFVGIVLLAIALLRLRAGRFSRESHFGLEAPIWYWHFVDAVWILLFAVFYIAFS